MILFVCLFEPGQVCWIRAKAEIKTSNPISYITAVIIVCFDVFELFSTESLVCIVMGALYILCPQGFWKPFKANVLQYRI